MIWLKSALVHGVNHLHLIFHHSDLPVAILSLDQEKAFDRVDRHFLTKTLQRMGFGQFFISLVRTLTLIVPRPLGSSTILKMLLLFFVNIEKSSMNGPRN